MTSFLDRLRCNRYASRLAQRLIAFDLGSSHIKVVLAENLFGRVRFLQHQVIDLQEEGLLSVEEVNRHLRTIVTELGDYPVALAIPQHLASAHLVELPNVPERDIRLLIQRDTLNLGGLSETAIIFDYHRLAPFGRHQNPFWVANAREEEIRGQIGRLQDEDQERSVSEITTAAGALITAFLHDWPDTDHAVLVDLGATSTIVAIVHAGQGVFATSYPIGSESFTSTIASLKKCSFEAAEALKRSTDLFAGAALLTGFLSVVDVWHHDLAKIIRDWQDENPELKTGSQAPRTILSGGGALQPGLLQYLEQKGVLGVAPWPADPTAESAPPPQRFAIARGLVYQTFRQAAHASSLLPKELRMLKLRQQMLMQGNWVGFYLLLFLLILLLVGSVQKLVLASQRSSEAADAEAALKKAQIIESLIQQRELEFAKLIPLIESQKKTSHILKTLQVLQQTREKKDLWFALLADEASYAAGSTAPAGATNRVEARVYSSLTNGPAPSGTLIAELCIPEKGQDNNKILRDLVDELRKEKLFRNVDALTANRRNTNLVDPRLLSGVRSVPLEFELADPENLRPLWRSNQPPTTPLSSAPIEEP